MNIMGGVKIMMEFRNIDKPGILIVPNQEFNSYEESEKLIRYITRTRKKENRQGDVAVIGGRGVRLSSGISTAINEFKQIQGMYEPRRKGQYGRHCYHEIYSLNDEFSKSLGSGDLDGLAYQLSQSYWESGHQVIYAIHLPDEDAGHLHIHFAVNAIRLSDGHKWHTSKWNRKMREDRFDDITRMFINKIGKRTYSNSSFPIS